MAREVAERPPGEVAILYRTNAQSRPFEEEMVRRRIPYVVVGGMKFYERAEVKDVLAYLRLAARPEDDLAFRRVVNVPARGIGAATLDKLAAVVRETGKSWWEVSADPQGVPDRARTALARFRQAIEDLHAKAETWTPSALLEHLLAVTGYGALYEGSEDREDVARRENIQELLSSAREFERRNAEGATVAEYLDTVSLATNEDMAESGGAVTLSTLHAAKGLEFPQVFVVGPGGGVSAPRPIGRGRGGARRGAAPALRRNDAREGLAHAHPRGSPPRLRARRAPAGPRASSRSSRPRRSRNASSDARRRPPSPRSAPSFLRPPRTKARKSTTGRCAAAAASAIPATASA